MDLAERRTVEGPLLVLALLAAPACEPAVPSTLATVDAGRLDAQAADASANDAGLDVDAAPPTAPLPPEVRPASLDFGEQLVGCGPRRRSVAIHNPHDVAIAVEARVVGGDPGGFFAFSTPLAPKRLEPGEGLTARLGFIPQRVGTATAVLRVRTAPNAELDVPLMGLGVEPSRRTDRWEQLEFRQEDVLFVVDDSPAMAPFTESLRRNLHNYAKWTAAFGLIDRRVALTTVSAGGAFAPVDGAAEERVLTVGTVDRLEGLAPERFVGPPRRPLLDRLLDALSTDSSNPDFLRPDAVVEIVALTPGDDGSAASLDFFEAALRSIKGFRRSDLLRVHAVTGGENGCAGPAGTAAPAPRLVALAERTGGVAADVCTSDWSRALEWTSRIAFGFRSRFRLTVPAEPGSIEVVVSGELIPADEPSGRINWTYDPANQTLNFTPLAVPSLGSSIRAEYEPTCAPADVD